MVQETVEEKLARIERMTQLGFKPGAAQLCRLILEKDPRNLQALIWLARTTSQPEEASQALQEAQAIAPNDPMIRNLRASGIGTAAPSAPAPVQTPGQPSVLGQTQAFVPAPVSTPTPVNNPPNPNPYATNATPPATPSMAFNPYVPTTTSANPVNPVANPYAPNPAGTASSSATNYTPIAQQSQPNPWQTSPVTNSFSNIPVITANSNIDPTAEAAKQAPKPRLGLFSGSKARTPGRITINYDNNGNPIVSTAKPTARRISLIQQIVGLVFIAVGLVVGIYWAWQLISFNSNISNASLNLTGQVTTLRSSELDVNVPTKGDYSFESSPQLFNALAPLISNPDGKSLAANSVQVYTAGKNVMWVDVVSPQKGSTKDAVVSAGCFGIGATTDWLVLVACIFAVVLGLLLVRGVPRRRKAS